MSTPEEYFAGDPVGLAAHRHLAALLDGGTEVRVSRSQVAYRLRRGFAYLWRPGRYVRSDVPVVLSLSLPRADGSPRWKEVAHPTAQRWMHHLEVRDPAELDGEVDRWVLEAQDAAR